MCVQVVAYNAVIKIFNTEILLLLWVSGGFIQSSVEIIWICGAANHRDQRVI